MESNGDFVQLLDPDVSGSILTCLDDPADIVRATAVSHAWRQFVIANGFCKKLCLRLFPEVSSATHAIEVDNLIETFKVGSNSSAETGTLENNHLIYALLAQGLEPILRNCISVAIGASSTDNYPEETVQNTLIASDIVEQTASYWSSKGESDSRVPETLTYRLISKLCFITEINIQPFQAYFQYGFPIYSAKAVRFRTGYLKSPLETGSGHLDDFAAGHKSVNEYIAWTYVSPEYPMVQENCLQKLKLPQPVLCIGGILQVELLGRVQRQEMDGLLYICVSHVQVVGRSLLPGYDGEISSQSGKCMLKYNPEARNNASPKAVENMHGEPSRLHLFTARLMGRAAGWEQILNILGNAPAAADTDDTESDEGMVI